MDFIIPRTFGYTGYAGVLFPIGNKKSAKKKAVQADGKKHQVQKVKPPANAKLNSSKAV